MPGYLLASAALNDTYRSDNVKLNTNLVDAIGR